MCSTCDVTAQIKTKARVSSRAGKGPSLVLIKKNVRNYKNMVPSQLVIMLRFLSLSVIKINRKNGRYIAFKDTVA